MKKIIVLNLKMNLNYDDASTYVDTIKNKISDNNDIIFVPSSIYLDMFLKSGYKIGAQNVHYLDQGAFTGEISPLQLKSLGIDYALVGHSERRIHFREDDELINNKVKGAIKNNLKVILCIGETDEERSMNNTASVIERQIKTAFDGVKNEDLNDIIIAYEPVWAIGSGKTPSPEDIEEAIKYIKGIIKKEFNTSLSVLYGGSVNKENIEAITNANDLDGVLIGSSSIDPKYLIAMLDIID